MASRFLSNGKESPNRTLPRLDPCWSLLLLRGPGPTTFLIHYLEHTEKQHAVITVITTVTKVRLQCSHCDRQTQDHQDSPRRAGSPAPNCRAPRGSGPPAPGGQAFLLWLCHPLNVALGCSDQTSPQAVSLPQSAGEGQREGGTFPEGHFHPIRHNFTSASVFAQNRVQSSTVITCLFHLSVCHVGLFVSLIIFTDILSASHL